MRRIDRVRVQPSTAEHVAALLDEEGKQVKPPPYARLSKVSKPVTELLWGAFDGYTLALVAFLDKILLSPHGENAENHYLVITTQQYGFLEIFVEHCRETNLERPLTDKVGDSSQDGETQADVSLVIEYKATDAMPEGAKNVVKKRAQNAAVSFHSSHRLRVRYVDKKGRATDRDYETAMAIKTLCHTLCDQRLKGKIQRLVELPHLIVRSLLATAGMFDSAKNPKGGESRRVFIEQLLSETARNDPWVSFQFRCPFIYDTALLDADVHNKESLVEANKRLKTVVEKQERIDPPIKPLRDSGVDIERLTLSIYLYYRLTINALDVPIAQSEAAFCVVMYLFEEAINTDRSSRSGLLLASNEATEAAKKDISSNPILFDRVIYVTEEAVRFVMSLANRLPAEAKQPKTISSIYEAAKNLKLGLDRIKRVDRAREEDSVSLRRMFFWQRNLQVTWRLVEKELIKHLSPVRAKNVRDFATEFPECCAFMIDPRVNSEAFVRSVRHLNRMHPSFRFAEVSFAADGQLIHHEPDWNASIHTRYSPIGPLDQRSSGCDEDEVASIAYQYQKEQRALASGLRSGSRFCVINDSPSRRCFILFDTPKSHQRFCNFSVMEALTTARQEKHLPMYPFLLRQYSGVFGNFAWCPTDLSKLAGTQKIYTQVLVNDFGEKGPMAPSDCGEGSHMKPNFTPDNIDDVDLNDDHENLWLFVKTLFFQLCSYTITGLEGCKRLSDTLYADVLMGNERDFKTYRLAHRVCATLADYMSDFPYFAMPDKSTTRPKTSQSASADPSRPQEPHVIDDISLSVARGKGLVHTAEVMLCFLCLGSVHTLRGDTIFRLRTYLHGPNTSQSGRHMALRTYLDLLDSYNANRNIIVEGELMRRVQLVFNKDAAYENNVHLHAPGVFDDLIFPEVYGLAVSGRREVARINSLLYRFVVDKCMSIDMRGQVLFDLDHQRQSVRSKNGEFAANGNGHADDDTASTASSISRFKKPTIASVRKRRAVDLEPAELNYDLVSNDDSQSSAAMHATEVLGSSASAAARLARIERMNNTPIHNVKIKDLPLRTIDRDEMPIYDVYRGLAGIRASGPLKQLCSGYQDALCYDLVHDLSKSVVYRGLEVAVQALEREVTRARNGKKAAPPVAANGGKRRDAAEALEKEHQFIISMLSKSSPPSIVRGMYCARGSQGRLGDNQRMHEAYLMVMTKAHLEVPPEPAGREPFLKCNFGQRVPIAYAPGHYDSMVSVMGSLTHLGKWRYEVASEFRMAALLSNDAADPDLQSSSMQPLCEFLRCLEWMLYHRNPALEAIEQRKRDPNDVLNSEKFWHIDADRFMWYQLNSKLPVDFNTLSYEEILHQMLDDSELKEQLRKHQQKKRAEDEAVDEEERLMIESILRDENSEMHEERALTGGELSDIADHFWTVKAPLSFIDNGGWTLRLASQEKEAEANLERGGPPVSEGLSLILEEYAQTISNLVFCAPVLSEARVENLPAACFIKAQLAEARAKAEELDRHRDKRARAAASAMPPPPKPLPVPVSSRRSPPRTSMDNSLSLGDFDIRLDDHGSNLPPASDSTPAPAMSWPGQLYIGERSASATRHSEKQQLAHQHRPNGHGK